MRTIKQYRKFKKTRKIFNENWDNLLNNVVLPAIQRINNRTLSEDIVSVAPMRAPVGILHQINYQFDYQFDDNEEKTFPFWKIKVIFKP